MMHHATSEEHKYLVGLRREKDAFEKLIHEKGVRVPFRSFAMRMRLDRLIGTSCRVWLFHLRKLRQCPLRFRDFLMHTIQGMQAVNRRAVPILLPRYSYAIISSQAGNGVTYAAVYRLLLTCGSSGRAFRV